MLTTRSVPLLFFIFTLFIAACGGKPTASETIPTATPAAPISPTATLAIRERPTIDPTIDPPATPTATPDPVQRFKQGMRPAFAQDVEDQAHRPRYNLRMWLDPADNTLDGVARIVMPNTTREPLQDVVLRLYPNLFTTLFGEENMMQIAVQEASVDGQPAAFRYAAQNTALRIPFAQPLEPDATTTLVLTYTATVESWEDGTWLFPEYYPMLSVYEGGEWRQDVGRFSEDIYTETAFYQAEVNVPAHLDIISSGTIETTVNHSNETKTYKIVTGPVRDFAFVAGNFEERVMTAGQDDDITLRVSRSNEVDFDIAQVLRVAAAAVTEYEQQFGAYPYPTLEIVLLPARYHAGWSHTGFILLGTTGKIDLELQHITAHEVAHQWWFSLVGSDIYRGAWLDESLAQYSAIIYADNVEGEAIAQTNWQQQVVQLHEQAIEAGDLPIGLPVDAYPDFTVYYQTVYGKGAVFIQTLRDVVGDKAFFAALQVYYQRYRYDIASPLDLQQVFEEVSGSDLDELFIQWGAASSPASPTTQTQAMTSTQSLGDPATVPTTTRTIPPDGEAATLPTSIPPGGQPIVTPTSAAIATPTTAAARQTGPEATTDASPTRSVASAAEKAATMLARSSSDSRTPAPAAQTPSPIASVSPVLLAETRHTEKQDVTWMAVASASSVRQMEVTRQYGTISYAAVNVLDDDPTTAWVEGVTGAGTGESLQLRFSQAVTITRIGLVVGFDLNATVFAANNRVKQVQLVFADGSTQQVAFADERGMQYRDITPVRTDSLSLVIAEVYPGTSYDDTALAEVEVWGFGGL
jgi:hypothetical protein